MKKNNKGFTLVELVIVIAVIAILSVVLIPQLTNVIGDAKEAKAKSVCSTAVTNYVTENTGAVPADGTVFASNGYYFTFSNATTDQLTKVETANYSITAVTPATTPATYTDGTKQFSIITLANPVAGVTIYQEIAEE